MSYDATVNQQQRAEVVAEALARRKALDQARSPVVRHLLVVAGFGFLGLGVVGIVVPLLPTTPFVLLAAACFGRSSSRFYRWLLSNRVFGHHVASWRINRCMPPRAKVAAIALIVLTIGTSAALVSVSYARVFLALVAVALVAMILRIPTCR